MRLAELVAVVWSNPILISRLVVFFLSLYHVYFKKTDQSNLKILRRSRITQRPSVPCFHIGPGMFGKTILFQFFSFFSSMAMTSLVKMGANFIIIYFRFTFKTIFWMCLMYSSIFTWSGAGICELMILVLVVRFNHEFGTAHSSPPRRFSPRLVHFMISETGVLSIGHWLDMVYPPPPPGGIL